MNSEIENIIGDFRDYLEKLDFLYKKNIYIDNTALTVTLKEKQVKDSVKIQSEKTNGDIIKTQPKNSKVVDLFGNIVSETEEWEYSQTLSELNDKIKNCDKCKLSLTRKNFVFGTGNEKADIVLVGEAPGADEDLQGIPFVGRAGKLLDKILEATGFRREEVYICNIIKCRPPGNRNPLPEEIEKCEKYLKLQLSIIKPKLILALGKFAAETLLNSRQPLNKMRGKIHYYCGIKLMVTFHPAALLRNPHWKKPTWDDMQQFKKLYDEISKK